MITITATVDSDNGKFVPRDFSDFQDRVDSCRQTSGLCCFFSAVTVQANIRTLFCFSAVTVAEKMPFFLQDT